MKKYKGDWMYDFTFYSSWGNGSIEVPIGAQEYIVCRTYGGAMYQHMVAVDNLIKSIL